MTVSGNQLALSLNNKVVVDAIYRLPPYQQRLSSKVSNAANRRVLDLQGILTRIMQSTSSDELIVTGVLALQCQCEARHYKIKDSLLGHGEIPPPGCHSNAALLQSRNANRQEFVLGRKYFPG